MVKLLFTPKMDVESYVKKDTKKKENIRDCITEQKVATDDGKNEKNNLQILLILPNNNLINDVLSHRPSCLHTS